MRLILLMLISTVAVAQTYSVLRPQVSAEGEHTWTYVAQWNLKKFARMKLDPEEWLKASISSQLGEQRLCPEGWEILKRQEVEKNLIITGRCKSSIEHP